MEELESQAEIIHKNFCTFSSNASELAERPFLEFWQSRSKPVAVDCQARSMAWILHGIAGALSATNITYFFKGFVTYSNEAKIKEISNTILRTNNLSGMKSEDLLIVCRLMSQLGTALLEPCYGQFYKNNHALSFLEGSLDALIEFNGVYAKLSGVRTKRRQLKLSKSFVDVSFSRETYMNRFLVFSNPEHPWTGGRCGTKDELAVATRNHF